MWTPGPVLWCSPALLGPQGSSQCRPLWRPPHGPLDFGAARPLPPTAPGTPTASRGPGQPHAVLVGDVNDNALPQTLPAAHPRPGPIGLLMMEGSDNARRSCGGLYVGTGWGQPGDIKVPSQTSLLSPKKCVQVLHSGPRNGGRAAI